MNDSKGLLVLKSDQVLNREEVATLFEAITPTAELLGLEPMVLPPGVDVELQMGSAALLERVCAALEKIAAQGEAPELGEAPAAPQALNARPSGLNSR